jgi:hypothetical protein
MGDLTYHDYLIQRGKQYQEKKQQKAQERAGTGDEDLTFKPNILRNFYTARNPPATSDNKWEELYLQAERKKKINKQDKHIDDILIQKEKDEYTFQPNSHKYQGRKRVARRDFSPPV